MTAASQPRRVGIVVNESREAALRSADELVAWLRGAGHEVRRPDPLVPHDDDFADGLDLVVSLGGDGSIPRSVALVGDFETPILGANSGQPGYLTTVEPDDARIPRRTASRYPERREGRGDRMDRARRPGGAPEG